MGKLANQGRRYGIYTELSIDDVTIVILRLERKNQVNWKLSLCPWQGLVQSSASLDVTG